MYHTTQRLNTKQDGHSKSNGCSRADVPLPKAPGRHLGHLEKGLTPMSPGDLPRCDCLHLRLLRDEHM